MDKSQIIEKISEHITEWGGLLRDWFVGISHNPERYLPLNHKVDLDKDKWIYIPANSYQEAREIVDYFINWLGTDGAPGEDNGARKIYAYKKSDRTNP